MLVLLFMRVLRFFLCLCFCFSSRFIVLVEVTCVEEEDSFEEVSSSACQRRSTYQRKSVCRSRRSEGFSGREVRTLPSRQVLGLAINACVIKAYSGSNHQGDSGSCHQGNFGFRLRSAGVITGVHGAGLPVRRWQVGSVCSIPSKQTRSRFAACFASRSDLRSLVPGR